MRVACCLIALHCADLAAGQNVTVRRHWIDRAGGVTASISMEDYVAAVLVGEAGGFRSLESLRAMAVAARTYAEVNRGRHSKEGFDFCDTTHCQDFRGAEVAPRFREVTAATRGQILWYGGAPAPIYYHADCGGGTEAPERVWSGPWLPYMRPKRDPYCARHGVREWQADVRKTDVVRALKASGVSTPEPLGTVKVAARTPSGRAERVQLAGAGPALIAASAFRFALGRALGWDLVRSTWFDVRDLGDRLLLRGRGYGHGVGMCQTGAARMGEEGRDYREILAFFFPGTELRAATGGVEWRAAGGERVDVLSTRPISDARLGPVADALVREIEVRTGQPFPVRPQLRVYPSPEAFRDATGQPLSVAASVRGRVIRLQPLPAAEAELRATLRYRLWRVYVDGRARAGLSPWFREGLAAHFAGNLKGDAAARLRVAGLIDIHGERAVLEWLAAGLPAGTQ